MIRDSLMPGMTANVSLIVEERQDVIVVPNSAFRFKPADPSANQKQQGPRDGCTDSGGSKGPGCIHAQ